MEAAHHTALGSYNQDSQLAIARPHHRVVGVVLAMMEAVVHADTVRTAHAAIEANLDTVQAPFHRTREEAVRNTATGDRCKDNRLAIARPYHKVKDAVLAMVDAVRKAHRANEGNIDAVVATCDTIHMVAVLHVAIGGLYKGVRLVIFLPYHREIGAVQSMVEGVQVDTVRKVLPSDDTHLHCLLVSVHASHRNNVHLEVACRHDKKADVTLAMVEGVQADTVRKALLASGASLDSVPAPCHRNHVVVGRRASNANQDAYVCHCDDPHPRDCRHH